MKQMSKHILPLTITAAILAATLCGCGNNTAPSSTAPVSSEDTAISSEASAASSEVSASSKEPAANSESAASSEQPESSSEMPAASSETPESSEAAEPEQASEPVETATADNSTAETTTAEQSAPAASEAETVKQQSNIKESYTDKVPKINDEDKVPKEEAKNLPNGGLGLIKEYSYIYDPDNNIVYEYDENGNPTSRGYNPDEYDPKDPYGNVLGKYGEMLRDGVIDPGNIYLTDELIEDYGLLDENGYFDVSNFFSGK